MVLTDTKDYSIIFIDKGLLQDKTESISFIPTFDNLNAHVAANPEISKKVYNPAFAQKYEYVVNHDAMKGVDWTEEESLNPALNKLVGDKYRKIASFKTTQTLKTIDLR